MTPSTSQLIDFIRSRYRNEGGIPLHAPTFGASERKYLLDCLDSTFVSSVGAYVDRFEDEFAHYTGAVKAVSVVNGTAGLHMALRLVGVEPGDLVLTQSLSFVATCNAIAYCGAQPLFADVDRETLGLSPRAMDVLLEEVACRDEQGAVHRASGRRIRACVPMHTFGHPVDLDGLVAVCDKWGISLVEDAAEALGSQYHGRHVGLAGRVGVFSFNGNKIVTTGGGGALIFSDAQLAARARHLTTTAKRPHPWEFIHDELGYNYRMPNINAALGCGQLERLPGFVEAKRVLAAEYAEFLRGSELTFCLEPAGTRSNYWLCAVVCTDRATRDALLIETNAKGISLRPVWTPMHQTAMYLDAPRGPLPMTEFLADHVVNLPSSPPLRTAGQGGA
ncbi:LegC family aminotransferase [Oryzomicrobium sp.]|uniref:LegC family aminotransferase n=1 Tax=Oryzomicrobium sp. TaxID=1911578 RepID=UPI002FE233F8